MAYEIIDTGSPDQKNGDPLRTAMIKINANAQAFDTRIGSAMTSIAAALAAAIDANTNADTKIPLSLKGALNGVAELDASGYVVQRQKGAAGTAALSIRDFVNGVAKSAQTVQAWRGDPIEHILINCGNWRSEQDVLIRIFGKSRGTNYNGPIDLTISARSDTDGDTWRGYINNGQSPLIVRAGQAANGYKMLSLSPMSGTWGVTAIQITDVLIDSVQAQDSEVSNWTISGAADLTSMTQQVILPQRGPRGAQVMSGDLNAVKDIGDWFVAANADAAAIANMPVALAGYGQTVRWGGTGTAILRAQEFTTYTTPRRFFKRAESAVDTWGGWVEYPSLSSIGGALPVAAIPTGIPAARITGEFALTNIPQLPLSKVTGAAPTATPTFTGVATFDQLKTTGVVDLGAVVSIGGSATFKSTAVFQSTVTGITAAMVGLGNANNTSDANKPISTATQAALDGTVKTTGAQSIAGAKTFTTRSVHAGADVSTSLRLISNSYAPTIRAEDTNARIAFVNNANSLYTGWVTDLGYWEIPRGLRIGSAVAEHKLRLQAYGGANGNCMEVGPPSAAGLVNVMVMLQSGGNVCGSIQTNDSQTFFNTTSDVRLKDKFQEFDPFTLIDSADFYMHEFLATPGVKCYGVKAHELQEVLPSAVNGRPFEVDQAGNIVPQQVDYSKLVPVLGEHAKRTARRVKALELANAAKDERITQLETALAALLQRVENLEQA